jgi:hypothetical protein
MKTTAPSPAMPAESKIEPKPFAVLDQRFPVIGQDPNDPFRVAAFATLAYCPARGGLVARTEITDQYGGRTFRYWAVADPDDKHPTTLNASGDWGGDLRHAVEESVYNPRRRLTRVELTPEERDIAAFAAAHPFVAARLGLLKRPDRRLFDVGPCYRPMICEPGPAADVNWCEFIDRHAAGDFGLNGQYCAEVLSDAEAEYLVGLATIEVRNSFACAGKAWKVVRSAYPLPGREDQHILISTCFAGRDPLTVASIAVQSASV